MLLTKIQVRQVTGKRNDTDSSRIFKNIKVGILFYYKVVSNIKSYRGDLDNE